METVDPRKENYTVECKKAKGGLPSSLWDTYSAFANTSGGIIYLGIDQINDDTFVSSMLTDNEVERLQKDLWSLLNDREKVSINLLSNEDVSVCLYDSFPVIRIMVKPAEREYKPVYINGNPFKGTYRRNHEGDYHCSTDEIKGMMRDSGSGNQDLLCLEELGLDVLSEDSISSYMNRFAFLHPEHVFLKSGREKFLEQLGAIRLGKDKDLHPTRAGLLMFGLDYKIVYEYPDYFLDYQEHREDGPNIRWTDRLMSGSGEWSGNLYDFYNKIVSKLTADLSVPFKMNGLTRIDETDLHVSIREALCNAISNSDFYLRGGLVVQKYNDRIEFTNPGTMRISVEQAYKGGESDARNKTILKMFNFVGVGERAGSGIPKILAASREYGLVNPEISENFNPDKVTLTIFLFPESSKEEIKRIETIPDRPKMRQEEKGKKILSYLSLNGESQAKDIAKEMGVSQSTVKKAIYLLMEKGLVEASGTIKDRKYRLKTDNC